MIWSPLKRRMLLCLVMLVVFHGRAVAEIGSIPETRVDLGLSAADFKWAEYGQAGDRMLEETGTLYGLDMDVSCLHQRYGWQGGAGAFFGEADYDGQTWSGIPVRTDATYAGIALYGDGVIGFRPLTGLVLKAFAGLGARAWMRDLEDTRTAVGVPVQGAEEWWGCLYGRLGVGAALAFWRGWEAFVSGGVKLPIYARNEADFQLIGGDWAHLEPEMALSGFGEAGLRRGRLGMKISWEPLRFDRSDTVSAGRYNLYQPDSEADVYKAEVFWTFGN